MDRNESRELRAARRPASAVYEDGDKVMVSVEMPGVTKEGLEVRIEGNELSIRGTPAVEETGGSWLLRERRPGVFAKAFTLDDTIDRDKVEASLNEGVLELTLHVKEAAKPRRIEIG